MGGVETQSSEPDVSSPVADTRVTETEERLDTPEEKSVKVVVEEDSYEARKEARRKEREEKERQLREVESSVTSVIDNGVIDEDSYEARREARRKAREARRLKEQSGGCCRHGSTVIATIFP